ncbi:MAG: exodeoxyribonuclease V subunit gamma [Chloroflexi bacterium]|nr:exodeoxyribonuclease V subunit gamma [Chloroflexota bacterium]
MDRIGRRIVTGGQQAALEPWLVEELADAERALVVFRAESLRGQVARRLAGSPAEGIGGGRQSQRHLLMSWADLWRALCRAGSRWDGRPPLRSVASTVLVQRLLGECRLDSPFAKVAGLSGFHTALGRLFEGFPAAGFEDAERVAEALTAAGSQLLDSAPKLAELARLYREYSSLARASFATRDEVARAATAGVPELVACEQVSAVYAFGFTSFTELQLRLLLRLGELAPLSVLLPYETPTAYAGTAPVRERFLALGFEEVGLERPPGAGALDALQRSWLRPEARPAAIDGSVRIVSAPSPVREVDEAARTVVAALRDGFAPSEIALLSRHGEPYPSLAAERLGRLGIPLYFPAGRPLARTPAGRGALLFLGLTGVPPRRDAIVEFLLAAPLDWARLSPDAGEPPVAQWDRISRDAGVVAGREQWRARLGRYREELSRNAEQHEVEIAATDELLAFVERLYGHLAAFAHRAKWSELVARLRAALEELFVPSEALTQVLAAVKELETLDRLERTAAPERFRPLASETIAAKTVRSAPGGVYCGEIAGARGLSFRLVCLLGLVERGFPAPAGEDPLLLDAERAAINGIAAARLPIRKEAGRDEPVLFQLAIDAARERLTLSYPRGRAALPSFYLLKTAELFAGRRVAADELERLDFVERVSASRVAPDRRRALGEAEYDRGVIERALSAPGVPDSHVAALFGRHPGLRSRLTAIEERWTARRFGSRDGMIADPALRAQLDLQAGAPISATEIEQYALCPQRYFLGSRLGLQPVEPPELIEEISALNRGSLVHGIVELFYRELIDEQALPLRAAERERYHARLDRCRRTVCDGWEAKGVTGPRLLWEIEQRELEQLLGEWLDREIREAETEGVQPVALELRFSARPGAELPPVVYRIDDERSIQFSGRIDRIDRIERGGRVVYRVVDYKTGKMSYLKDDDKLQGGRFFQLPVYLLAAQQYAGRDSLAGIEAQYYKVSWAGGFRRVTFHGDTFEQRREEIAKVAAAVTAGIASGAFFPYPGEKGTNCQQCDYGRICGGEVVRLYERKAGDERIAPYVQMQGIE